MSSHRDKDKDRDRDRDRHHSSSKRRERDDRYHDHDYDKDDKHRSKRSKSYHDDKYKSHKRKQENITEPPTDKLTKDIGDAVAKALEKAKDAARMKQRIAEQYLALQENSKTYIPPLILDDSGRQIDTDGKEVHFKKEKITVLRANIKKIETSKEEKKKQPYLEEPPVIDKDVKTNFIDSSVHSSKISRNRRGFSFHKPGHFTKQADAIRAIRSTKTKTYGTTSSSLSNVMEITHKQLEKTAQPEVEEVFDIEWWDEPLLKGGTYNKPLGLEEQITSYIQHPVPLNPVCENPFPPPPPLLLTKKEQKKIRRMRRLEKEKEKTDKIRLGLIPPPEPRMKLGNMMKILSNAAIQDPSAVEAKVRAQMRKRQLAHELTNQERKLTPQQRAEKKRNKMKEDIGVECQVSLFKVGDLSDTSTRFKIDANANQLNLSGCTVLCPTCNIIVVEGGPTSMKRFTRLLLHRIKWNTSLLTPSSDEIPAFHTFNDSSDTFQGAPCSLVWKGVVKSSTFKGFRFENCSTDDIARKFFDDRNIPQYFDLVKNYLDPLES